MAYSLNEWLPFMQIDISVLGCVCGEWVCDGGCGDGCRKRRRRLGVLIFQC